ncbi:transglycosylase domain-containing protein [Bacillus sp. 03113]|uniref:transglycosylase domain-containing protein n=1 Tax=Bacillus sp. 03113 TaxID=2578211 RepID=UPI0011422885|nr:PBP1A family penicillin-binding protein [Bacillus sp. 03113]
MKHLLSIWKAFARFWNSKHLTQVLLLITLVIILLNILLFAFLARRVNVQSLKDGINQSTIIYDKDGDVATSIKTNRTEGVTIEELPDYVKNAVIAIEDERFYKHHGFDVKGITRAFIKNLFAGSITGGGSTITQQLTKNALLSPQQTYKRKIEELFLAVEIEKHYKKDEILQMYLNQVYFGSGAWGIDEASKKYFNKDIENVTVSEAALMAGLLQAPSALNPFNHYDRAIQRRNIVLSKMKEEGFISASEYEKAKKENIVLKDGGGNFIDRKYPYYVDAVIDEAINKYGLTQEEILTRGYSIYTEMDQNIQTSVENLYKQNYLFPRSKDKVLIQSGAVLLDPSTGGVRGLVGGRGKTVFRGFNRATHLKAQPGSTMKPLAVYTPALEEGYTYSSTLKDEKIQYGSYTPENFSKTYKGEVPMYEAIEDSLNAPAVWLLNEIGLEKGLDSLRRYGIPLDKEDEYLGVALGGMHKGISPLQLAEAYTTFPNGGKRSEGHLITKIVGPTGDVLVDYKPKTTKVTSKAVADEMTSMLLNVVETGTGKGTQLLDVPLAGKSGSTQLPYANINGTKDQWFVGYTPNLVGAVWLGYDQTDQTHYLSSRSSENVIPIFKAVMKKSTSFVEPASFDVQSVNDVLAGKEKKEITEEAIEQRAKEIKKEFQEKSDQWKQTIDESTKEGQSIGQKLKEKIKEIFNQ